jgi:hypothetical protein
LAVGDVNGDHLEDVFVGAAAEGKASIYLQQANGKFIAKVFPETNLADNMGTLFFDADGDHDLDLWISSGVFVLSMKARPSIILNFGLMMEKEILPKHHFITFCK